MLVPFVIDPDSIKPDPSWTPSDVANHTQSLLRVWRNFGLLHHDGQDLSASKLYSEIEKLPPTSIRSALKSALAVLPRCSCTNGWAGCVSEATLGELSKFVKIALVDDAKAEVVFDVAEDAQSVVAGEVEVCRIKSAEHAKAFLAAEELSGSRIAKGTPWHTIWAKRLRSLASAPIKHITIVDRYAAEQHIRGNRGNARDHHGRATMPIGWTSGLERFLRELNKDASGARHVTLYASHTKALKEMGITADAVADELDRLLRELPTRRIKKLTLYLVLDATFARVAHGRYLRFGRYIWDIDLGLQVLEGGFSPGSATASFKSGEPIKGYDVDEATLRTDRQTLMRELRA